MKVKHLSIRTCQINLNDSHDAHHLALDQEDCERIEPLGGLNLGHAHQICNLQVKLKHLWYNWLHLEVGTTKDNN